MSRFMTFLLDFNKSKGLQQAGTFLVLSAVAYNIATYRSDVEIDLLNGRIKIKPYRGSLKIFAKIHDHKISVEETIAVLKAWFIEACEEALHAGDSTEVARRLDCTESQAMLLMQQKDHFYEFITFEATNDLVSSVEDFKNKDVLIERLAKSREKPRRNSLLEFGRISLETNSFRQFLTEDDFRQLLNTSKRGLEIRKENILYRLTEKYSLKYCEDENFRYQLLTKVEDPLEQIIVKLEYSKMKEHEEVFNRFPVHLICTDLEGSDVDISLRNVKEISLHSMNSDIGLLMCIDECKKITLQDCPGITHISPLRSCEHLILNKCENIKDFSGLDRGVVKILLIKDNPLSNVNDFRFIRNLTLQECNSLHNVSPLYGIYDLSLIQCKAVSDISSLGRHHRLEVSRCSEILSGYYALKDIPVVKLVRCDVTDVSVLSKAKVVYLEECGSLVDLIPLRGARELTLRDCESIEDISMLTTVQKLTLRSLPHVKNYEGIDQMKNLSLQVTSSETAMIEKFPNVRSIESTISSSFFDNIIPLLPAFTNLHSLTLCNDSAVKIEVSFDIPTVIIECCGVKNISGLGKNRVVRLFQCQGNDLDVSCLATVPLVSIIQCQFKKVNYESLENVPRLKIDN